MSKQLNSHIKILLVEDDPSDVLLTKKVFAQYGLQDSLSSVSDGVEALAYLKQEGSYQEASRPSLIFLDLNMPRMDGREFLQVIKADQYLKRIPVIVLTTSNSEHDVDQSYDLHANCFVTKSVDFDRFSRKIYQVIDFWSNVANIPH